MGVTIVANEFSETTQKEFQQEADKLVAENHYGSGAIMEHFAKKGFAVSMITAKGGTIISCYSFK